jgi:uncharacterized membrane protein YkoI
MQRTIGRTLGAVVLGLALLGTGDAANRLESTRSASTSSIQVPDHDRNERGERPSEERREAIRLAHLAKIALAQATAAALAQVPGTVLEVALDNEDGNLVYSVEILTSAQEIKDVKVDAGTGQVLHVDADDAGEDDEDD